MATGKPSKTTVKRALDAVGRVVLGPVEGRDVGPSDKEIRDLIEKEGEGK